jgi:hypothetical protein
MIEGTEMVNFGHLYADDEVRNTRLEMQLLSYRASHNKPQPESNAIATPCHHVKNTIDLNVRNFARGFIWASSSFMTA